MVVGLVHCTQVMTVVVVGMECMANLLVEMQMGTGRHHHQMNCGVDGVIAACHVTKVGHELTCDDVSLSECTVHCVLMKLDVH